ncbi:MAG TPA: NmrA family NAD(P)-binding protein [Terriglobales bacterium]|nr:NmrA family NAD(P)-binding protein [Terriglobales bacterium]
MLILVTAAAGRTGRAVVRALAARGVAARALVRRPEQVAALRTDGAAEVVVGDLRDRAALRRAVHGAGGAYYICPEMNPDEAEIGGALIKAMRDAGAWRLVYHSVLHPQADDLPHHLMKLHTERRVVDSGLAYTILQPAPYMQNLAPHRYDVVTHGVYRVPYSVLAPFSWIDLRDVAQVAARVLADPGHDSATYELAGPEPLSSAQVAERWAAVLGRPVRAETMRREAWVAELDRSGVGGFALEARAAMTRYYDRHGLVGNPNALTWLLPRPPHKLPDYLRSTVRRPVEA